MTEKNIKNKYLIFLDIDGTLIAPNQEPNSPDLPMLIDRMSREGFLFGLNSNRSFEDIVDIYSLFHLNGPLILENGSYFLENLRSKKNVLGKDLNAMGVISKKVLEMFIQEKKIACEFFIGDTVEVVKSERLNSIPLLIALNSFRKYTGSIHIYKFGIRDYKLAERLADFLRNYFKEEKIDMLVECPKSFGNVIFWSSKVSKGRALKEVKGKYSDYKIVMIGDDLADLETMSSVNCFFTVGNAQRKVKASADYVSKNFYTKGVIDILKYIKQDGITYDKK